MRVFERKYILKNKPGKIQPFETIYIEQAWLSFDNDVRIRKETRPYKTKGFIDSYYMIMKSDKISDSYDQKLIEISYGVYNELLKNAEGTKVEKLRKRYNYNGYILDIDDYKSIPDLKLIEVEFDNINDYDKFNPLADWFGVEVSQNDAYKNINLAKYDGVYKLK